MSEFKPGDRVRITIEGPHVAGPPLSVGTFKGDERTWEVASTEQDTVTVEKIEAPVEVFGPGDLVRRKGRDWTYALAPAGYVRLHASADEKYSEYGEGYDADFFTSEYFERVAL